MASSGPLGQEYGYFRGMGLSKGNAVLPPQAIPKNKKNEDWKKATLDNLEKEGLRQYFDNLPMNDYYKMVSGDMAYIDVLDDDQDYLLSYVNDFKEEKLNIPSQLKHWDLMFPLVSKIVGEWSMQNDKLRFDTTDEVSTNDYIRERTHRLEQFTQALFKKNLYKMMLLKGIDISQDFKSEEEYQQFQQQQNQIIQDYYPDMVDADLKKNFKTEAAQWAEKTWDRDYERFRMNILESLEARDILLVGKSARHYRIGYDYYYPEYWHPIEVFHSKESSVTRLEDCEYVGRVKWYTVTELINTYGDILSENERKSIYKAYFGDSYTETYGSTSSEKSVSLLGEGYFERMMVPFEGYSDHKLALEFEEATGIPLSEKTDLKTGEVRPSFSVPLNNSVIGYGSNIAKNLRNDIEIRTDTIQTTEGYFKGFKKIGLLTYRAINGYLTSIEVDEDILPETLKEYNIKNLRKTSLSEYNILSDSEKENTIIWIDSPIVYRFVKIKVSGIGIQDDIYKLEELPYQIKGEKGNIFDLKLPVCGHIGNSYCKLIRPYQITYNYFMNQTQNYLTKEIGAFFVIDVNAIPTDYFDLPEGDDALIEIRNIAKTTGFLATDFSRNTLNQNGGGLAFNPMVYNNATFTEPIMRNLQLADKYKWMAYETLGLTPQAMGSPSQYATAEGIQVGQKAYFAQTYNIDQTLMENKRANVEVHMSVAQYCQLNNKDANYIYMASNNELDFITSIKDEDFSLRKIDVRATYNAKKNMMFQQLKQALIQNNTMGNDAMSLVELFMSDDFLQLKEAAFRARAYTQKMQEQQIQAQQQQLEAEQQYKAKMHADQMELGRDKIMGDIEEARIMSLGRAVDRQSDQEGINAINQNANLALKRQQIENENENERLSIQKDLNIANQNLNLKLQELGLEKEKINLERQKLKTMQYQSDAKNFDSLINKN